MPSLFEKIWDRHVVKAREDDVLLYIDRHLVHEVTSPQAFAGLSAAGRSVRRPGAMLAVPDHNVPTTPDRSVRIEDRGSREQIQALRENALGAGIALFDIDDPRQGIVHIIGPESGLVQPGITVVCGDSHTGTLGAFGAIAFGIGTSEVEHVLATQTLWQKKPLQMRVAVNGTLGSFVTPKDVILAVIAKIGAAGGTGYALEFSGETVRRMSMEGRMTVCNMTIEAGARFGLIAPDEITFAYLKGRPLAPPPSLWDAAVEYWKGLPSDLGCEMGPRGGARGGFPRAARHLGDEPAGRPPRRRRRTGSGGAGRPRGAGADAAGAGVYGALPRDADDRHPRGQGVHRLLHQLADRGPAGRRRGGEGAQGGART